MCTGKFVLEIHVFEMWYWTNGNFREVKLDEWLWTSGIEQKKMEWGTIDLMVCNYF